MNRDLRIHRSALFDDLPSLKPIWDGDQKPARLSHVDKSGDHLIYGPEVARSWTAMRGSTVLTIQFPPSNADSVLP